MTCNPQFMLPSHYCLVYSSGVQPVASSPKSVVSSYYTAPCLQCPAYNPWPMIHSFWSMFYSVYWGGLYSVIYIL